MAKMDGSFQNKVLNPKKRGILPYNLKRAYGTTITPSDVRLFLGLFYERRESDEDIFYYELDSFAERLHPIKLVHYKVYREIENAILCLLQGKIIENEKQMQLSNPHIRTICLLLALKHLFEETNRYKSALIDNLHENSPPDLYIDKSPEGPVFRWHLSYPLLLVQAIRFSQWELENQDYCFEFFTAKRARNFFEDLFNKWFQNNRLIGKDKFLNTITRLIRWQTIEGQYMRQTSNFGLEEVGNLAEWDDPDNEKMMLYAITYADALVRANGYKYEITIRQILSKIKDFDSLPKKNLLVYLESIEKPNISIKKPYLDIKRKKNINISSIIWSYSRPAGFFENDIQKYNWKIMKEKIESKIIKTDQSNNTNFHHYAIDQKQRNIGIIRKIVEYKENRFELIKDVIKVKLQQSLRIDGEVLPAENIWLIAFFPCFVANEIYQLSLPQKFNQNNPLGFLTKSFNGILKKYKKRIPLPMIKRITDLLEYYSMMDDDHNKATVFPLRIVFDHGKFQIVVWLPEKIMDAKILENGRLNSTDVLVRYLNCLISNYGMIREYNHVDFDFSASKNFHAGKSHIWTEMINDPNKCKYCKKNLGLTVFDHYLTDVSIQKHEMTFSREKYIDAIEKRKMINPYSFYKGKKDLKLQNKYVLGIDVGGTVIKIKFYEIKEKTSQEKGKCYILSKQRSATNDNEKHYELREEFLLQLYQSGASSELLNELKRLPISQSASDDKNSQKEFLNKINKIFLKELKEKSLQFFEQLDQKGSSEFVTEHFINKISTEKNIETPLKILKEKMNLEEIKKSLAKCESIEEFQEKCNEEIIKKIKAEFLDILGNKKDCPFKLILKNFIQSDSSKNIEEFSEKCHEEIVKKIKKEFLGLLPSDSKCFPQLITELRELLKNKNIKDMESLWIKLFGKILRNRSKLIHIIEVEMNLKMIQWIKLKNVPSLLNDSIKKRLRLVQSGDEICEDLKKLIEKYKRIIFFLKKHSENFKSLKDSDIYKYTQYYLAPVCYLDNNKPLEISIPTLPLGRIIKNDEEKKYKDAKEFADYIANTILDRLSVMDKEIIFVESNQDKADNKVKIKKKYREIMNRIISIGLSWPGPIKQNRIASTSRIISYFKGFSNEIRKNDHNKIANLDIANAVKDAFLNKREKNINELTVALANDGDVESAGLAFGMLNCIGYSNNEEKFKREIYRDLFEGHSVAIIKAGTGTAGSVLEKGNITGLNEFGKLIVDLGADNSYNLNKKDEERWPVGDANKFFSLGAFQEVMKVAGVPEDSKKQISGRDINLILKLENAEKLQKKIKYFGVLELVCLAAPYIEWDDFFKSGNGDFKDNITLEFGQDSAYRIINKNSDIDNHTWWKLSNEPLIQSLNLPADKPMPLNSKNGEDLLTKLGLHRVARLNIGKAIENKQIIIDGIKEIGRGLGDIIALLYDIYELKGVVIAGGVLNSSEIANFCMEGLKEPLEKYLFDTLHSKEKIVKMLDELIKLKELQEKAVEIRKSIIDKKVFINNKKELDKDVKEIKEKAMNLKMFIEGENLKGFKTWIGNEMYLNMSLQEKLDEFLNRLEELQKTKLLLHLHGENQALLGAAILGFDYYIQEQKITELQKLSKRKKGNIKEDIKFLTENEGIRFMKMNAGQLKISVDDDGNISTLAA